MLYLLWAIITIASIGYAFYVILNSLKLVWKKLGIAASVVLALIIFSSEKPAGGNPQDHPDGKWEIRKQEDIEPNTTWTNWINIDSALIVRNTITYQSGILKGTNKRVPIFIESHRSGWSIGTEWKPLYASLDETEDGKHYKYTVNGETRWVLFSICLFTQYKTYSGMAPVVNHF